MERAQNEVAVKPHHRSSWSAVVTIVTPLGNEAIASRSVLVDAAT